MCFQNHRKNKDFANGTGEETEEYILRLDLDQAQENWAIAVLCAMMPLPKQTMKRIATGVRTVSNYYEI
jgi:hypothetical protein